MNDADTDAFLQALAAPGQPQPTFVALEALVRREVGAKLFTIMVYDASTKMARRVYTSHASEYPVAGEKPLSEGLWSQTVIEQRRPFVANSIEAIAEVFPDYALIKTLGCASVVNWPVEFDGEVIGTINALDAAGRYTQERVARLSVLAPFFALAMLAAGRP
jgi:GAF domain